VPEVRSIVPVEPPTGTVTYLFTDVAGSTRLWEADSVAMASSLAAHDAILLSAIDRHLGYVFSTAGDSYGAAFPTPAAAVAAAVDAQLALANESWPGPRIDVRMGIHTGTAEERAGNYFGPDVNRAARVMSAGNGGQVLLSGATVELVRDALADPLRLVDRGTHPLKDIQRAEHLFEVRHPDLREVRTPLAVAAASRSHLPDQLTAFIGREAEVTAVAALVADSRLVTLTGPGGTGKTRLAIEVAERLADHYPDGAWLADLSHLDTGERVIDEVAAVWDLRPGDDADTASVVAAWVSSRSVLLVLDNCEHVLDGAARVVSHLLGAGPGVRVVTTSRESLGVPGETVMRVPSLGLDADGGSLPEATRLFLDRARRVNPELVVDEADLSAIGRITRRLEGIPLGIELAAARVRVLSPGDLAARLDESFRVLGAATKGAVGRQGTLEATIDWSHALLEPEEASLFRRVSVCVGGFDLSAAEAIGVGGEVGVWAVLELVDHLVDKSLLVPSGVARSRFRMLEPIRHYALERLADAGESARSRLDHARHYASVVADVAPRLIGGTVADAHADLTADLDNIRSALATLLADERVDEYLTVCAHLAWYWSQASMPVEGLAHLAAGLDREDAADPGVAARAWIAASILAVMLTDRRAVDHGRRAITAARRSGDDHLLGWAHLVTGMAEGNVGNAAPADHLALFTEATRLIDFDHGQPMWHPDHDRFVADFLRVFGRAYTGTEAVIRWQDAFAEALDLGDDFITATLLTGSYYLLDVDDQEMLANLRQAVDLLRRHGFNHALGHALIYLGRHEQEVGLPGGGLDALDEGADLLGRVGDLPCSMSATCRVIDHQLGTGDLDGARRRLATTAGQVAAFDRALDGELVALAARVSAGEGDLRTAARLLGHVGGRPGIDVESVRTALGSLATGELEALTTEGAGAGRSQVLRWLGGRTPHG
jgi:predicted ATPase/class 3 adenylate cyclase